MAARTVPGGIGLWDVRVYVHQDVRERPGIDAETFVLEGAHVENTDRETGAMMIRLSDGSHDIEHDQAYLFMLNLSLARLDFGRYSTTITGVLEEVRAYRDLGNVARERCTDEYCADRPAHDVIAYLPPALGLGRHNRFATLSLRPHVPAQEG